MQIKYKNAWIITAATFAACLVGYLNIDAGTQVPVHWNVHDQVDRTATPLAALLPIPLVQLAILTIFALLNYIEPRKENLKKSAKAISVTATATVAFLALVELVIIFEALGNSFMKGHYILVAVGLLLAVLGNYMSKIRSGFFVGIRTPWTLSSDKVWQKTHRLGGRLFVATGILMALFALTLPSVMALKLTLATVLVTALVPIAYSWWAWRTEKTTEDQ